jgi:hypothetical protein
VAKKDRTFPTQSTVLYTPGFCYVVYNSRLFNGFNNCSLWSIIVVITLGKCAHRTPVPFSQLNLISVEHVWVECHLAESIYHWNLYSNTVLKGQCHEIFDLWFFPSIPPRALIHGLKPFRIWIRIRREHRLCNSQNRLPRPDRDRWSGFSCLIEAAEAASAAW